MDIDLLLTKDNEAGLIADSNLVKKVAGVIFTGQTGTLTLEYVDMDYLDLNIPVEKEFLQIFDYCFLIHIGAFQKGHIAQAYQVPLMIADDPYRAELIQAPSKTEKPLLTFEHFIKRCASGQPVHRDDLGDENKIGCILGDAAPAQLQFAPHLARRRNFEAAPKAAPGHAPGLGLGGSSGSSGNSTNYQGDRKNRGEKE